MLHLEDRLSDCKPPLVWVFLFIIASVKESLFIIINDETVGSFATTLDSDLVIIVSDEITMKQDFLKHGALRINIRLSPSHDLIIIVENMNQVF